MPGVDFQQLKADISMQEVLDQLGFQPTNRSGVQWRGACPIHPSRSARSHTFSVNLHKQRYCCHRCGSKGNQLELWAAVHNLPLHEAALDLCRTLGRDVPWIHRW